MTSSDPNRVRARGGSDLQTLGWPQEAALRMLQNSVDPELADPPERAIAVSGPGKPARDAASFDAMVRTLAALRADETMIVQSGRPVGVLRTHEWAPRVLLATANVVGDWANVDEFRRLEALGLTMHGHSAAGSWMHVGSQETLQGTYTTFNAVAEQRFGGTLAGTITLTAGLGAMGGAQPLAITMNGGVAICVEVTPSHIARRVQQGYLDTDAYSLDHALEMAYTARDAGKPLSIGLLGNAAAVFPAMLALGAEIDIVTDQTSAHDPLAYLPVEFGPEQWASNRVADPIGFANAARHSMAKQVEAMVGFQRAGAAVFDYGNNIRTEALVAGYADAFAFPGFVPAYIRPLFAAGRGPFRWVALSGDPADIAAMDRAVLELLPENESLTKWIRLAGESVQFQGLPARICWLGHGERDRVGLTFNEMVASGELTAPVVIGRDALDAGSVASPYRETEAMADGSDAIADWPLLNALVNASSGATWVSIQQGGGAGIGRSTQAGQATVADGTALAAEKLARVLTNDPATGILRHVEAGYDEGTSAAERGGVRIPMRE